MANDFGHESASHAAAMQPPRLHPGEEPLAREAPVAGPKTSQAKSGRPEQVCGLCGGGCW